MIIKMISILVPNSLTMPHRPMPPLPNQKYERPFPKLLIDLVNCTVILQVTLPGFIYFNPTRPLRFVPALTMVSDIQLNLVKRVNSGNVSTARRLKKT
jgi:hypothetical protein